MEYYVYLIECADKTYYCGYTTDIERRIKLHNTSKLGAKYTHSRRPVTLMYYEAHPSLSMALKREYQIKKLSRENKSHLISTGPVFGTR